MGRETPQPSCPDGRHGNPLSSKAVRDSALGFQVLVYCICTMYNEVGFELQHFTHVSWNSIENRMVSLAMI